MLETVKETMKGELFDYLNYLIKTELYPYLFQVKGKYTAKNLHKKIEEEFETLLSHMENGGYADIDATGLKICRLMDIDLNQFILSSSERNVYFLDLQVFAKDVGAKIRKIINNYKNSYDFSSINAKEIKKLAQ